MSERRYVTACLMQKPGAWEELVRKFSPAMLGAIRRTLKGRSDEDPLDLLQETFVSLVKDSYYLLRQYDGRAPLKTYLCLVAVSRTLERLRKKRIPISRDTPPEELADLAGGKAVSRGELSEWLRSGLRRLDRRERLILTFYFLDGMTLEEIGSLMRIPRSTVADTLERAREHLRKHLS